MRGPSLKSSAPRPYVAFAAVNPSSARRLYRAQNLVWIWLGIAAMLQTVAWLVRPHLGFVLVSHSEVFDALRFALFAIGGLLISVGVWTLERQLEVSGHVLFATGAILNAIITFSLPGRQVISLLLLVGLAVASGFRAYYIVRWINAPVLPPSG